MYIAAYLGWARLFRAWIDPWLRRQIGAFMGVRIVWVDALHFPLGVRIWGVLPDAGERVEAHVALVAAGVLFGAALVPIVALSLLLSATTWVSTDTAHALYLVSVVLLILFLRWATSRVAESA